MPHLGNKHLKEKRKISLLILPINILLKANLGQTQSEGVGTSYFHYLSEAVRCVLNFYRIVPLKGQNFGVQNLKSSTPG